MVIAVMLYALAIESFWMFAVFGVCGVFAREVTLLVLPVWCARDVRRGVTLTIIALIALLIERSLLFGPPDTVDPMRILMARLHHPENSGIDILATWGWAFAVTALGISLLPTRSFRAIGPMSLGLFAAAFGSYLLATDLMRLFGVLIPIVAIAATRLLAVLAERRQRILLTSLCGLIALQFCVSGGTRLSYNPAALAAMVRPMRLGMVWTIAMVFILRREFAHSIREKLWVTGGSEKTNSVNPA